MIYINFINWFYEDKCPGILFRTLFMENVTDLTFDILYLHFFYFAPSGLIVATW